MNTKAKNTSKDTPVVATTMREVAALAGCSLMTVSLALRDSVRLPAATRLRIREIAEKNGYRPNPLVAALVGARKQRHTAYQATIGFLTNYPLDYAWKTHLPAYSDFYESMKRAAGLKGYGVDMFSMQDPNLPAKRLQSVLVSRGIHALVIAPTPPAYPKIPNLDWRCFSVMTLGYSIQDPCIHRISHDYAYSMSTVLVRCREKGYRRIGFLMQEYVDERAFKLWLGAYMAEQQTSPGLARIPPLPIRHGQVFDVKAYAKKYRLEVIVGLDSWLYKSMTPGVHHVCLNADDSPFPLPGIKRNFSALGIRVMEFLLALLHSNDRGVPTQPMTSLVEGFWSHDELLPQCKGR